MKASAPQRKLLLHFDTNKTILLADASKKFNKETLLQELCAGYAWGKIETKEDGSNPVWKLHHPKFVSAQPAEGTITYRNFLETVQYADKTEAEEANEEVRTAFNKKQKEKRREEMQNFIRPSAAGSKLKADFDKLNRDINLPKAAINAMEDLGIKFNQKGDGEGSAILDDKNNDYAYNKDPFTEIFKEGKYNILPSFFKMMLNLKKLKREFAVVFRSFDTETPNIIYEFNKFCEGNHPCFNGKNNFPLAKFDGFKGSKNFIIDDKNTGVIYRESYSIDDTSLVTGTLNRATNKEKSLDMLYKEELKNNTVKIHKESADIYLALTESLKDSCAFAIQDDFEFWNMNGGRADCGKPFIVDPHDYNTLQIFFDDSIQDDEYSIVDCRDLMTKSPILTTDALNKYLVRVDPLAAITDQNYFVKMIEACEKTRQEEIERLEHGVEEEAPERSEWEILQSLDDSEYLRRTILPLLHPAFEIVDMERPEDPLSFIAFYVLKNKNKVNIPQPPELPDRDATEELKTPTEETAT